MGVCVVGVGGLRLLVKAAQKQKPAREESLASVFFFLFLPPPPTLRGMKTRQIKSSPPPPQPDRKRNPSRLLAARVWNARWAIKAKKKKQVTLDSLRK